MEAQKTDLTELRVRISYKTYNQKCGQRRCEGGANYMPQAHKIEFFGA